MRVLVIGGGGREHALVWKLRQSPNVEEVFCAPGNGGICEEAQCIPVDVNSVEALVEVARNLQPHLTIVPADVNSVEALVDVARNLQPHLTIVGPEVPLANGVVDEFHARGWRIFGPTRAAARLESSKSFAKEFMQRFHIPTAHYAICQSEEEVKDALAHFNPPIVVKADGLAAGKGVVLAESR